MSATESFVLRDATVGGLDLKYLDVGEGPPLLLVHGIIVSHKEWLPLLPHLTQHFRCIVPDLPGFGGSAKPTSYGYSREDFTSTLVGLLDFLELPKVHLCGHSMGGGISLTLAADHPDRVEALTVMNSMSFKFTPPLIGRVPLLPVVGELIFKRLYRLPAFKSYFVNEVFSGDESAVDMDRVEEYYADLNLPGGRDAAFKCMKAVVSMDSLEPRIPNIKAPTLVLWGGNDRLFPIGLAHRLTSTIKGAKLTIFEDCGHAPNEQRPEDTAQAIVAHHLTAARTKRVSARPAQEA